MSETKKVVYPLRMDSTERRLFSETAKDEGLSLAGWVRGHLAGICIDRLGEAHPAVKAFRQRDVIKPAKKPKAKKGTK